MLLKNNSNSQLFIFVHGAWHASWCWERVANQLIEKGHKVLTPDLPGHGTNIQSAKTVTFNDYVSTIVELTKQQHTSVTLVGHSMAGLVISQVAEIIPEKIQELVYLSAYIPSNQQSLLSIADECESRNVSPLLIIDQKNKEIRLQSAPEIMNVFFNCCKQADAEYAISKLQTQPLQPFTERVTLGKNFERIAKKSLVCRDDRAIYFNDQMCMSVQVTDNIVYLDADHAAYYSAPDFITSALI